MAAAGFPRGKLMDVEMKKPINKSWARAVDALHIFRRPNDEIISVHESD